MKGLTGFFEDRPRSLKTFLNNILKTKTFQAFLKRHFCMSRIGETGGFMKYTRLKSVPFLGEWNQHC